ncbi:MAG: hypothetical protein U1F68_19080 [Gammaproteobacteria bacterium]
MNGSPNTIAVPASVPRSRRERWHHEFEPAFVATLKLVEWSYPLAFHWPGRIWNESIFPRPSYQNGLNSAPRRSIPDVVVNADPANGAFIAKQIMADAPAASCYGGTSMSAPIWAAFAALLNESQGRNLGAFNPLLYARANTHVFNNAAALGSDFTLYPDWSSPKPQSAALVSEFGWQGRLPPPITGLYR